MLASTPTDTYPDEIKRIRARLGLTQKRLAELLGVSFVTVNRWENGHSKPSQPLWGQLMSLVDGEPDKDDGAEPAGEPARPLDFTAPPGVVRAVVEAERLSFGHMVNPTFATETSNIDPLPHQRIAVYEHMLGQPRLRFLLADDAGAGKTIMTGLYVREMLSRRLLRRVLIAPPAGLVGNWRRELETLFDLQFRLVEGPDARIRNPFVGEGSDLVIVSVDTLAGARMFGRLGEKEVLPYDLVVFDEAHKLSASRGIDLRERKTNRYKLAEAVAGVPGVRDEWELPWHAHHLLLLTATPHMGKDYPYYALWRLLEPTVFSTPEAFAEFPAERRERYFIRRTKEEMVRWDKSPIYPKRVSDTLGYELTQGAVSEQRLYDETTEYLQNVYNKAKVLNQSAARLAMGVFQRRLASSTYALLRSFERRIEKLDAIIADIISRKLTIEQILTTQRRLSEDEDVFESLGADEEDTEDGLEQNQRAEERLLRVVVAASLADLEAEKEQVQQLLELARHVNELPASKFEKLREQIQDPQFADEKLIIFTEHRDTLDFLVRRLHGLGYTGQVAQIHGGMPFRDREETVELFRRPMEEGGARFLVCTDAAGEGINLQFCWVMINYDVPWNPARLEQRMGRIHRYKQQHDPVVILNLVAPKTREGKVLKTLLDKLEKIRKQLKSDKVFDVIGRLFEDVSIKEYMGRLLTGDDEEAVTSELDGHLTPEQVEAIAARERSLYGAGGDVESELPRLQTDMERETFVRLMPGYMRGFIEDAAPLVDMTIDGDLGESFSLRPSKPGATDPLLEVLEQHGQTLGKPVSPASADTRSVASCGRHPGAAVTPTRGYATRGAERRDTEEPSSPPHLLSVNRPNESSAAIWLRPGEAVFERFRGLVLNKLGPQASRGAVFVDPTVNRPYLFHLGLVSVVRHADGEIAELGREEVLVCKLVGVRQYEDLELEECPLEHLLLLRGGGALPAAAQRMALTAGDLRDQARAFLAERIARSLAVERRDALRATLPEREEFIRKGFAFQEAELSTARANQAKRVRAGKRGAQRELDDVKRQQRELAARREHALTVARREPELIAPTEARFVAHALCVPSTDPADKERYDANAEQIAMQLAIAFEKQAGAAVRDVHTPPLARAAGLTDNPGFDLLSIRPDEASWGIEVKGQATTGEVELSENEWRKACNMGERYWLYAVYGCATGAPQLRRVRDPFGKLLARQKGSVLLTAKQVEEAAEPH